MKPIANKGRESMWPPLELATRIFDVSSIAFFASLAVGLVATGLIIWMGYVKEHHWAALREEARAKTAAVESETAKAHAEIEKSRAAIAAADARAAEAHAEAERAKAEAAKANLELAKLLAPRTFAPAQRDRIIAVLKNFAGQRFSFNVYPDPEPLAFLGIIDALLKSADWERIPSQVGAIVMNAAGSTAGTAYDRGMDVLVGPDDEDSRPALMALASALTEAGVPCTPHTVDKLTGKTPKAILINVGKSPNHP